MSENTTAIEDVEQIIELLETDMSTRFEVDDYEFRGGLKNQTTLTVTLTKTDNAGLSENDVIATKKCIAILEESTGENPGVPIDAVIDTVSRVNDISKHRVESKLDRLRTRGEIYEPQTGFIRTS